MDEVRCRDIETTGALNPDTSKLLDYEICSQLPIQIQSLGVLFYNNIEFFFKN